MPDQTPQSKATPELDETEQLREEQPERSLTPLERILQSFTKAREASRPHSPTARKELGKDKSRSFFVLVAAAVMVLLIFLAVFSSPQKPNQRQVAAHRGQPDLGRRVTPGQDQQQSGSVTPLLTADTRNQAPASNGAVTPEDINRTAHLNFQSEVVKPNTTANTLIPPAPANPNTSEPEKASGQQYALGRIDFSDPALKQQYAKAGYGPDYSATTVRPAPSASPKSESDLKKASLVFVRNDNTAANLDVSLVHPGSGARTADMPSLGAPPLDSVLPAGTRLVARLESPVSTAVAAPVVAAIEYNYERDGEIVVPAGSKAIGKLEQASSSGYVSLRFDTMEFPDGTTEKMDGTSMGLDFVPVRGLVTGKKRGTRFLVQTLTGLGTMASYLVGAGNLSGSLSESALLRERIADNAAIAGQNELNQLAFNQNIMVTVPGNTRFYVVLQKTHGASGKAPAGRNTSYSARSIGDRQSVPSLQELQELLQLKQELSQLYQQGSGEKPASGGSQEQ